jgi:hypothetical protein
MKYYMMSALLLMFTAACRSLYELRVLRDPRRIIAILEIHRPSGTLQISDNFLPSTSVQTALACLSRRASWANCVFTSKVCLKNGYLGGLVGGQSLGSKDPIEGNEMLRLEHWAKPGGTIVFEATAVPRFDYYEGPSFLKYCSLY